MKRCSKCSRTKPLDAFYARQSKCKSCAKAAVRANYRRNRDHYVAYDKEREQRPERKAWKSEAQKRYNARNPGKRRARVKLGNAVRDGKVMRQACMGCGSTKAQAHHPDYRKALSVAWLCKDCHWRQHGSVLEVRDR